MGIRLKGFAAALVAVAVGVSGAAVSVPSDAVAAGKAKVGVLVSTSAKTVKPTANQPKLERGIQQLLPNTTYKAALNGTKKHKIRFTVTRTGHDIILEVKVGNNVGLRIVSEDNWPSRYGYTLWLVQVNRQRTLLFVHHEGNAVSSVGIRSTAIYDYVSGKFSRLSFLSELSNIEAGVAYPQSAGNNKFNIGWHIPKMRVIGAHATYTEYSFSNGKVKQIGNEYPPYMWKDSVGTLARSMTAYKAPGNSGGVAFKAAKGNKIKVLRVKNVNRKGVYIKVQKSKKVGWIDINTPGYERLFTNAAYS